MKAVINSLNEKIANLQLTTNFFSARINHTNEERKK